MECIYSRNAVITILLLVGQISARPQPNEAEEFKKMHYDACSGKYPITHEIRANIKKSILPEDRNFKCFLMCILDKLSLIDAEGVIDGKTWISLVPESIKDVLTKAVSACLPSDAVKPDACEAAFSFLRCGMKAVPELIYVVPLS